MTPHWCADFQACIDYQIKEMSCLWTWDGLRETYGDGHLLGTNNSIGIHSPRRSAQDQVSRGSKHIFSPKHFSRKVYKDRYWRASVDNLVASVWTGLIPPKVEFFMWLAFVGKLNTKDLLLKKGVMQVQENRCTFCSDSPKEVSHLLVLCLVAWHTWINLASDHGTTILSLESFRMFYETWIYYKV